MHAWLLQYRYPYIGMIIQVYSSNKQQPMKQCSVVLVDDDSDDMALLKEAMEESGKFNIIAECDAEDELIDVLQHADNLPDAIICDLNMPAKTGIEVHNDLRSLDSFADIPFILMSGMGPSPSVEIKAAEEGLTTVMIKPSSISGYYDFCVQLYSILVEKRA